MEGVLKQLRNTEKNRQQDHKLNYYLKWEKTGALATVLVQTDGKERKPDALEYKEVKKWKELTEAEEVYRAIIDFNTNHLLGSSGSPFATTPLVEEIGLVGGGEAVDQILNGTYHIGTALQGRKDANELQAFITALLLPKGNKGENRKKVCTTITREDFQGVFRKAREKTASYPGIHMGNYKAISMDNYLSEIHAQVLSWPFQYGFTYARWQRTLHAMLMKEDHPYIHRLRIIQLFETDFNAAIRILYCRRLIPHGDKYNLHNPQALGGRKGHVIHDLLEQLQVTAINSKVCRQPTTYCFNDQTGNFDQIRPNLTGIEAQRLGMPNKTTIFFAKTLTGVTHGIRTGHGISEETIDPTPEMGEIGQGVSNGPACNHVQTCPLIEPFEKLTHGVHMQDPTGEIELYQWVLSWIDDNTNTASHSPEATKEEILQSLRDNCQTWHHLACITGGELSIHKCVAYIVIWIYTHDNTRFHMSSVDETPGDVTLPADEDPQKSLKSRGKITGKQSV